ncbi:MAG: LppP/LprE family lipoprotein [Solirubrobacterales bacterium]|jgi:hypothetical protein|nr:LppP/LprE family lipoprotein [Solirubrobacterales bacterium]
MQTPGPWLSLQRALAVLGLLGLFLVAGVCVNMIVGAAGGRGNDAATTRGATVASTPSRRSDRTPTPAPKPAPLTRQELAQRRAAAQVVRQQGFDPISLKAYHSHQTLRVLLAESSATSQANGVPAGRRAFFFVGDSFIEADAPEPSSKLQIARQTENTVTLAYGLTAGEEIRVRFRWDGSALAPRSPVPPAPQRLQ